MYHQQYHHHHHHQQPPAAQQKHSTSTSTSSMHFHKRHRHSHSHSHSNVRNHAGALFVQLVVLIVCIVLACPCCVLGQYGFDLPGYPNSYYTSERFNVNNPNVKADRYDSFANATLADERLDEIAKELKLNYPSLVYIRDDLWSSGVSNGFTYERYELNGFGPLWQILCGQPTLYIDLTRNETELHDMGVEFVSDNHTVSFSLEYVSEIDEEESIHAHGILGGHWTDGVPFLNTAPLKRDQKTKIVYNIDPKTNSGTYFLHSHYGFNALHGVGAPLIIQSAVDALYPKASIVNNANTQELLFYAEDWCLVYSNADDVDTEGDDYTDAHDVRDPAICQNPFLTLRALYGEWNTFKGKAVLDGPNPELRQCLDPVPAPEFGSAFFLVNDRSANDARLQQVTANTSARLRVINAARMTNFLLKVPDSLAGEIIAVDGSYIVPVKMSDLNNEVWVGVAQRVDILLTIPAKPDVFPIIAVQEMPAPTDGEKLRPFSISLSAGLILYSTDILPPQNLIPQKVNGTGMLAHHPEWIKNQERKFTVWPSLQDKVWQSATQIQVALTGYNGIFGMNFLRGLEFPPVMMSEEAFVQAIKDMAPLAVVKQNDLVCINMTNYSWDTHPMHLHGHHFQVVDMDGEPFSGAIRDTVLVPAGKCHSVNICFEAFHRAGQFGLHCHMAIHEMAGMFGIIRYGEGTPLVGLKAEKSAVSDDESAAAARVGVGVGVPLGLLLLLSFLLNVYFVYKRHSEARGRYERVNPVKTNFTMPAGAGADADGDGDGDEEEFETKSAAEGIAMVDMNSDDT